MIMKTTLQRKTMDNITLLLIAFENFEKKITQIFDEHCDKIRFPGNQLKSRENQNQNKNDFYSTKSNLRVETESYTTKNKLRESNSLAHEMPNIYSNNSNNNYLNTVSNFDLNNNHKNENNNRNQNYFNHNNYKKEISSINSYSKNNDNFRLQSLIKNQIESNSKAKSRSVQKMQLFDNSSNDDAYKEQINYTYENTSANEKVRMKKNLEIPMINLNKKFSANHADNSKLSENINKNNFYRNLFLNNENTKEQNFNTHVQLDDNNNNDNYNNHGNNPVKLLNLDNPMKKVRIPLKKNKNTINLGMLNTNHNKI